MPPKTMLTILVMAVLSGQLRSQAPLSLKECIEYSLHHHPLQAISNSEIAIAQQRSREGLSSYLPQVNGSFTFDDNLKRPTTVIPAGTFSPQEIRVQFGNQYSSNAVIQLDQLVYDRSLLLGIKLLYPYTDIATLTKEKNELSLMYAAAMSYYAIQIYREQQKLLAKNEEKFQTMERILQLQVDKGVARKMDHDRVSVTLANIQAQRNVLENEIQLANNRLKNAMGMPLEEPLLTMEGDWNEETVLDTQAPVPGTGKVYDLLIQQKNIDMQALEVRRRQAMYLPTLGVYARAGAQSFGNDFVKSFERYYGYASIGLRLNVPIWNSFRTPMQIKQAELNLLKARENYQLSRSNIMLQQQNAETQWLNALATFSSIQKNMELAEEVVEVTQLQLEQGVATLSDYLTADYAFKEAQTNYITSLLKVLTSRLELEMAHGTLKTFLLR
ncbi:MAG: hypothetical protein RLZZ165_695 [Bacteroidota bacterium]